MDLQPLLDTLNKVSMDRVLPYADLTVEGDISIAKIPVRAQYSSDRTDSTLRKYAADWLRGHVEGVAIDTKFEKLSGKSWYSETEEIPIAGIIILYWWKKPPT